MSNAAEILPLFALADESTSNFLGVAEQVQREEWSEHGRTDIEVRFGRRGFLLIEVKVQATGSDLNSQLRRYVRRAAGEQTERTLLVLLGTDEPDENIAPFTFTGWGSVCRRLRQYAARVKESDLLRAAAILIFCGAVEQNLCGLSLRPKRFGAMATVDYLRKWSSEA